MGDIGDGGKYSLLRAVIAAGLGLAVNWYGIISTRPGKQDDGKYTSYLDKLEPYKQHDPELFDCLAGIVHQHRRSIEVIEAASGMLTAAFFSDALTWASRSQWHQAALPTTAGVMWFSSILIMDWRLPRCVSAGQPKKSTPPGRKSRTTMTTDKA